MFLLLLATSLKYTISHKKVVKTIANADGDISGPRPSNFPLDGANERRNHGLVGKIERFELYFFPKVCTDYKVKAQRSMTK